MNEEIESYDGMSVNGMPYKKENGKWVPDEESARQQYEHEAVRNRELDALTFALRSRVLTSEEMVKVENLGIDLYLRFNGGMSGSYKENDLIARLNGDLLQQFRLQQAAKPNSGHKP